jgi:hypothetical protein
MTGPWKKAGLSIWYVYVWTDMPGAHWPQEGCHYVRVGVTSLGTELQQRGRTRHAQYGARGTVYVLSTLVDGASLLKRTQGISVWIDRRRL